MRSSCTVDKPKRALDLYVGLLGFEVVAKDEGGGPDPWGRLGQQCGPSRLLAKTGSRGGSIRLTEVDHAAARAGSMELPGPFAIDFYVRDLDDLVSRVDAQGFRLLSEPQDYVLFGQDFTVRECIFEGPAGISHTLVQYIPARHRCVLSDRPDLAVSEVVAIVHTVSQLAAPLATVVGELGAQVYFDQIYEGEVIERLLGLRPGTSFRMMLLRGQSRRNARLELIEIVGPASRIGGMAPVGRPPLILGCSVQSLPECIEQLRSTTPGQIAGPYESRYGSRRGLDRFGFRSAWGAAFEFWRRA